jgi:hypothetical protein
MELLRLPTLQDTIKACAAHTPPASCKLAPNQLYLHVLTWLRNVDRPLSVICSCPRPCCCSASGKLANTDSAIASCSCVCTCSTRSVMCAVTGSSRQGCRPGSTPTKCCCTRSIHATTCSREATSCAQHLEFIAAAAAVMPAGLVQLQPSAAAHTRSLHATTCTREATCAQHSGLIAAAAAVMPAGLLHSGRWCECLGCHKQSTGTDVVAAACSWLQETHSWHEHNQVLFECTQVHTHTHNCR